MLALCFCFHNIFFSRRLTLLHYTDKLDYKCILKDMHGLFTCAYNRIQSIFNCHQCWWNRMSKLFPLVLHTSRMFITDLKRNSRTSYYKEIKDPIQHTRGAYESMQGSCKFRIHNFIDGIRQYRRVSFGRFPLKIDNKIFTQTSRVCWERS